MDVIKVSEMVIVLEVIVAILIFCFVAYVFVARAIRTRKREEKLIHTNFVEKEVSPDIQEPISNEESIPAPPTSAETQAVINQYEHQLLENAFDRISLNQIAELPEWKVQLAKAEARLKEDTKEAVLVQKFGKINPILSCPYCREKGKLRTKYLEVDIHVDEGMTTDEVNTEDSSNPDGAEPPVIKKAVQAYCGNCGNIWTF